MSRKNRKLLNQFIVNPKFQFNFLSFFLGLAIVNFMAVYALTDFYLVRILNQFKTLGIPEGSRFQVFVTNQISQLLHFQLGVSIAFLFIMAIIGFYLSAKIAGPLYRLTSFFDSNEKFTKERVKFRDDDYFQELSGAVQGYFSRDLNSQVSKTDSVKKVE